MSFYYIQMLVKGQSWQKPTSIGNWSSENPLISWWLLMMSLVKKTNSTVFNTLYCLNVCFRGTNQDWVRKYQTQIHIINLIISELFVKELPCLPSFSLTLTYHPMLPEMLKPHASTVQQWYLVQWRQLPTCHSHEGKYSNYFTILG